MNTQPDWNTYREQFPAQYWARNSFDQFLVEHIQHFYLQNHQRSSMPQSIQCLDVGGGVWGTECLQPFVQSGHLMIDMLDPLIEKCPNWYRHHISWGSVATEQYDVIVLRGSINYLTPEELHCLYRSLRPHGILLANTFLTKPSEEWNPRPCVNSYGEHGIETSRWHNGKVEHVLIYPSQQISHYFYYYSAADWLDIFPSIEFTHQGKSTRLMVRKLSIMMAEYSL